MSRIEYLFSLHNEPMNIVDESKNRIFLIRFISETFSEKIIYQNLKKKIQNQFLKNFGPGHSLKISNFMSDTLNYLHSTVKCIPRAFVAEDAGL